MTALAGTSVLDLTVERGWLCGRLLADLGADVIKVEPPGGDPGRTKGLFADPARPDIEENLSWWFQNRGKSSVVLDLDDARRPGPAARARRRRRRRHRVVRPGLARRPRHRARGAAGAQPVVGGHVDLAVRAHRPYADWSATDLTVAATTGELWLTGDVDRPPLRVSSDQLFLHAGAEAAVHTLVALSARAAHRSRAARRRLGAAGRHQVPDERPGVPRPGGLRAVPLGTGLRGGSVEVADHQRVPRRLRGRARRRRAGRRGDDAVHHGRGPTPRASPTPWPGTGTTSR